MKQEQPSFQSGIEKNFISLSSYPVPWQKQRSKSREIPLGNMKRTFFTEDSGKERAGIRVSPSLIVHFFATRQIKGSVDLMSLPLHWVSVGLTRGRERRKKKLNCNIVKGIIKETGLLSFLSDSCFKFNANFTYIFKQHSRHLEISSFHNEIADLLSFPSAGQPQPKT